MQNNKPPVHGKGDNKRILSLYNESLVRRMKDILDLKDMENYSHDLRKQNRKNNGRLFILPDKIIEILARIRAVFNHENIPGDSRNTENLIHVNIQKNKED